MSRPLKFILALAGCLAAGCATHRESIVLFSSPGAHSAEAATNPPPAKPHLEKAEESKIEQAVFACLLERHFWDDSGCSAIFLQADEATEKAVLEKFPNHRPPLKPSYHAYLRDNQAPLDRDTNKSATVLSVEVNEPNEDGSVAAIGRWYAGGAVAGFYSFTLQKIGGDWRIQNVR